MDTYSFVDQERAIVINRADTPSPWINYLSNGNLHAFVSQAGGGMCWWKSPSVLRLTRYRAHHLPIDSPGFYTYIRESDGTCWSPTVRPCDVVPDVWRAIHRPGITRFEAIHKGLGANLELFITPDMDSLVWTVELTNFRSEPTEINVFGYVEFSLHEWLREFLDNLYFKHQLKTWFDAELNSVLYLYHFNHHVRADIAPLVAFGCNAPISSFDGDRDRFVGPYRFERNPVAVERGSCFNSRLEGGEPCGALHTRIANLEPGETRRIQFYLAVSGGALTDYVKARNDLSQTIDRLRDSHAIEAQRAKLYDWWDIQFGVYQCELPDHDSQRQINIWNPVQSVHTGRYSRSISSTAPGKRGVGFRDTCQDMLAIAYRKPAWATEVFVRHLSWQLEDGHAAHEGWLVENQKPDISKPWSDDHLWLPMLAHAIIAETGDTKLLDVHAPWLRVDGSGPVGSASVWQHLCQAMEFTHSHRGQHGLPLTLSGDWNDIIGRFSRKGKGESVFAAQQYCYVLGLMATLAKAKGDEPAVELYMNRRKEQLQAIADCAWDGQWWCRGFDDEGSAVGSHAARWGRIFLNPQSWAVIGGCGTEEQRQSAMGAVSKELDTDLGLTLLAPGFDTFPNTADPFSGYNPGCGENGAIFCHANTWAIIAEALLGNAARAWKYYRQLIPHRALQKAGVERYQAEPYAYVSNIIGPENVRFGFANVTQVTGTAAWMDIAATQYLLGVKPEVEGLRLDPCIPAEWESFTVLRKFRDRQLNIRFENPDHVSKGVASIRVSGILVETSGEHIVPVDAFTDGNRNDVVEINVRMGKG